MKKIFTLISLCIFVLALAGCGASTTEHQTQAAAENSEKAARQNNNVGRLAEAAATEKKILVVYYTRTGNTRELANQIREIVNADSLELKTVRPYPQTYNEATKQAKEELESGFKPELEPLNVSLQGYDTIILGSPLWWGTVSTPMMSFLSQNDLSGKTILPFVTHGGSGIARSVAQVRELAPNADVKEGLAIRGSDVKNADREVRQWLQTQGLI